MLGARACRHTPDGAVQRIQRAELILKLLESLQTTSEASGNALWIRRRLSTQPLQKAPHRSQGSDGARHSCSTSSINTNPATATLAARSWLTGSHSHHTSDQKLEKNLKLRGKILTLASMRKLNPNEIQLTTLLKRRS